MANRTAVASGGSAAKMVDGNGVPVCAGGGGAYNNLQPYIVVYMYKRVA